jgi:hypothetical protein
MRSFRPALTPLRIDGMGPLYSLWMLYQFLRGLHYVYRWHL